MRDFKISVRITDTSPNLSRYFSDITKEKILDPQVEADLAMRAKEGDIKARERIILANLRFVVSVAKSYTSKNAPLEDLISEGNKGLIEAMEVFDPTAGFKFISYAVWHIRKNIFVYLSNNSRVFRIPSNVASELKRYQSMEDFFIGRNGREPSVDEILLLLENNGIEPIKKGVIDLIKNKPVSISLESSSDTDDDYLKAPINWIQSEETHEKYITEGDVKFMVISILSHLNPRERMIVEMKYGLEGKEPMSFNQIANYFDLSPEWARNNFSKIEKKMKIIARKKGMKNYI
jgi:RNA polymerase primary sigma factor